MDTSTSATNKFLQLRRVVGAILVAVLVAGCSGGVSTTNTSSSVTASQYTVGGSISGLSGAGLTLQNNGGDTLTVGSNGAFTFPTPLISGDSYSVAVMSQPSTPDQTCVATANTGIVADNNVTTVTITCATKSSAAGAMVMDTIGGTAVGVLGSGLVLQNDGVDNLSVPASGSFTFKTALPQGLPYAVSVLSPPINPYQDCAISGGSGTTGVSDINNIQVSCTTNANPAFTIGGTVSGVSSAGAVVLQDNGRDNLTITTDGPFTFPIAIPSGSSYSVTSASIRGQQSETCAFANASGTVDSSNVTNVTVTCRTNVPVSVTVSGLLGGGLVLQDNATDNLPVSGNGTATFATALPSGSSYSIAVASQPQQPTQTCTVTNGTGVAQAGTTPNVTVSCKTDSFSLGGTVTGVSGTLVLQINGANSTSITTNGAFTFPTALPSGTPYTVTVLSQSGLPSETCSVANGTGIVGATSVTNLAITCAINAFPVGGTISGLTGTGLVLQDNGGNNLAVAAGSTTFTMAPVASGAPYAVTVLTQPAGPTEACTVTNGTGTVAAAAVSSVAITCAPVSFTVGGTISGLTGLGLVLQDNGGNNLTVAPGSTTFAMAPVASGVAYNVTVLTPPTGPTESCQVHNGTGTVGAGNVTSVTIACTPVSFTVGGTISGLTGTGLVLQDNNGNNLTVAPGSTTFTMAPVASGLTYNVTVLNQPTGPTEFCQIPNGTGTVGAGNVTSVSIACVVQDYSVGGTVSGLLTDPATGNPVAGLSLQDNAGTALGITANGSFTFPGTTPSGNPYAVTIATQPGGYACAVANGSGTVASADITSVSVSCSQIGAFLYVTNGAGGNISGFAIDANTGTLQPLTQIVATPTAANAIVGTTGNDPSSIVIGGCNGVTAVYVANEGANSISAYTPNLDIYSVGAGAVTPLTSNPPRRANPTSTVPVMAPSFLDFIEYFNGNSYKCQVLALGTFQASGDPNASLFDTLNNNGALAADAPNTFIVGTAPVAAANAYLSRGEIAVEYIADQTTDNVYAFENVNGNLTPLTAPYDKVSDGTGSNPDAVMIVQPSSQQPFVYVANYGTNTISQYTASSSTGDLTPIEDPAGIPVPPASTGSGPSALAQANVTTLVNGDPVTTTYVYVANHNDATISAFSVSLGTVNYPQGQLVPLAPMAPTSTGQSPVAMSVVTFTNPDSTTTSYLYVVNSGSNSVMAYDIDSSTGALTPMVPSSFAVGSAPTAAATATVPRYTVGGTISNLYSTGLTLQDNGSNNLTVAAETTTFTFTTPLATGATYNVTVLTSPSGQVCSVTSGGTGTVGAGDVTSVSIACTLNTPEIDPRSAIGALALLLGALMVLRSRFAK